MKNYSINKEKSFFILHYEIVNDSIKIYYSNGDTAYISYNDENEKQLLEIMNSQLNEYDKCTIKNKIADNFINLLIYTSILVFCILPFSSIVPLRIIASFYSFSMIIQNSNSIIKCFNINRDYKKHQFFVENSEIINEIVEKQDKISNISKKEQKIISNEKNNNKEVLNINTIDKMKLKTLRNILNSIKEENGYSNVTLEEEKSNQKIINFPLNKR